MRHSPFKSSSFTSKWYISVVDGFILSVVYCVVLFLRFDFDTTTVIRYFSLWHLFVLVIGSLLISSILGVNKNAVRYTSVVDVYSLIKSNILGLLITFFIVMISRSVSFFSFLNIPSSVVLLFYFIGSFSQILARLTYKAIFDLQQNKNLKKKKVLIYGAGAAGIVTKEVLQRDLSINIIVKGFVDRDISKIGKKIDGVLVYSSKKALTQNFIDKHQIEEVVFSIQNISPNKRIAILQELNQLSVKITEIPPVSSWFNDELTVNQIKRIRIEDLLNRTEIDLEKNNVASQIRNQVVLISGAAGSIGSEIARQVLHYHPKKVVFVDNAETGMFHLNRNLSALIAEKGIETSFILADISNTERLDFIFSEEKPSIVYHAAAYKHVPLMEDNPEEAIRVNVLGSKNMADLAAKYNAQKFIMVSTDKAVNPTNIMGASKRIAEIYIQSLNTLTSNSTKYITTRFGNVLGSNGSVIPVFREQIKNGGPITVTSDQITRYFMTIPEACQLVMEAGCMGNGGEVFVFDMGKPVRIVDLAKKMIHLSGLKEGKDISIEITGLRPGEKLYEELLNEAENTLPTHHPKILIGKVRLYDFDYVMNEINLLLKTPPQHTNELVKKMKTIVPEFKSNNSVFSKLD